MTAAAAAATAERDSPPASKRPKSDVDWPPHPAAVLDDEYHADDVELVDVYVGRVRRANDISVALRRLKTALPMPAALAHLKRARRDEIVLAPTERLSRAECVRRLAAAQLPDSLIEASTVRACRVPAGAPKTRAQHARANVRWPCNFHPCRQTERLLANAFFARDELETQRRHMRVALDAATAQRAPAAAVVVDPRTDSVVAVAVDRRRRNPSHHAVVLCVERVAAAQRARMMEGRAGRVGSRRPPDRVDQPQDSGGGDSGGDSSGADGDRELPYLCTGYDVYVTREPCIMCAMALVHSRVRRVFYGRCTAHGALGTRCKLHRERSLNHRYLAFKNLMDEECGALDAFDS